MANCKFFSAEGLTGSFCSTPRALFGPTGVVQVNASGSTDFDLEVFESSDQIHWTTVEFSQNLNSADQPFTYKCLENRYVKVCGEVYSGALDLEAFLV